MFSRSDSIRTGLARDSQLCGTISTHSSTESSLLVGVRLLPTLDPPGWHRLEFQEMRAINNECATDSRNDPDRRPRHPRLRLGEAFLVGLLCCAAFVGSWSMSRTSVPLARAAGDLWFDSDSPNVYKAFNETTGGRPPGPHTRRPGFRSHVHPLFWLLVGPPMSALRSGFGLSELVAIRSLLAACAALWALGIYLVLRWITERALDSFLFCLLALVGSAQLFWFATAETYPFGALSIVLVLLACAYGARTRARELWFVITGALSIGVTVTNWMVGIAAAFACFKKQRSTQICANSLLVAVLLWSAQKVIYPESLFFLQRYTGAGRDEQSFVLRPEAGGLWSHTRAFLFHSTVAPELGEVTYKSWKDKYPRLSFQHAMLLSGRSVPSLIALVLWSLLLLAGIRGIARPNGETLWSFRLVLLMGLGGQFALHAIYGIETFLYSLHFQPLLILMAAYGARTRLRPAVLVAVVALVPLLASVNLQRLHEAWANISQRPYLVETL